MPFVEHAGYRLHYRTAGPPAAPPLLLIMGLGLCSAAWDTLPALLAERFRVIAFDNRGVGRSTIARGFLRIRDLADDAARVLDGERAEQAFVFGLSMGGMIAQELALRHPARVRALALGATFGGHLRSHKPDLSAARDLLLVGLAHRPRPLARLLVSDDYYARNEARFLAWFARQSRAARAVLRRQLVAIALHEAERRLPSIRAPTLVITGDRDRLVPVENSRRLARLIPGARLVELPGAGHAFPFERAEETTRLLAAHFLAEGRPGDGGGPAGEPR